MTTDYKNQHRNPNSIKTKFAFRFLRAMKKLRISRLRNPQLATADKHKRYHKYVIKTAAYASMASAVGPRRAWSRAILLKIRNRKLHLPINKSRHVHFLAWRSKGATARRRNPRNHNSRIENENDLRELVPGGEGMDLFRLLFETAHYIKCLRAQVQVMKNIVDYCSN